MAREALARVDVVDHLDIDAVLPFTTWLVDSNWPSIQLLANHLLIFRELDYEAVIKLIQTSP
jgi:hypothetical protein